MKNQNQNHTPEPAGFLHEIGKQEKDRHKMQTFQDMFSPKFYFYEYSQEHILAKIVSYVCSSFSVATGFFFLYSLFLIAIGVDFLAIGFALIILIMLEYAKHLLFPKVLVRFYATQRGYIGLALINLLLVAASVGLSVKGIEQYSQKVIAQKPALVNLDSLKLYYEKRTQSLEQQKNAFQNSVSWNGKINIYDANTANRLAEFDRQIAQIHKQQTEHLNLAKTDNEQRINKADNHNNHTTFYLVLLCSLNELLCLFALWYIIYYKYKSSEEIKLFLKNLKPIQVRMSDFPLIVDAVRTFLNPDEQKQLVQAKNTIGFQLNEQSNKQVNDYSNPPKNQENFKKKQENQELNSGLNEALNRLLNYPPELIQDIRNGQRDYRTLLKKHNVNPKMVKEVIEILDNN